MVRCNFKTSNFCLIKIENKMENKKPDNVVYSVEAGYNANVLPYATQCRSACNSDWMMWYRGKVEDR
jgi:hypothetical protein